MEKPKEFLKKIQEQPESTRKIILWVILGLVALIFIFIWVHSIKTRF